MMLVLGTLTWHGLAQSIAGAGDVMESDRIYFLRRAEEEHAAGVEAANVEARQAHIELAWRYRNLAEAIEEHETRIGAHEAPGAER